MQALGSAGLLSFLGRLAPMWSTGFPLVPQEQDMEPQPGVQAGLHFFGDWGGAVDSEESQEQASPGRENRGSSEKGWAREVFYPRDSSESARPMNLLVATTAASSPRTGPSDLGTIKGQRASQARLSSSALRKRRVLSFQQPPSMAPQRFPALLVYLRARKHH